MRLTYRGQPGADEYSGIYVFEVATSMSAGFVITTSPQAVARVAPVDRDAVFSVYKLSGTASTFIGTITLAQTTGAATFSGSATSFAAGDAVYASAPPTSDAAMADIVLAAA